jgi:hypothetical protein
MFTAAQPPRKRGKVEGVYKLKDHDEIILKVARIIQQHEMTISEFYEALGVDLVNLEHSNTSDFVMELSGIFKGWENPPPEQ